MGAATNISWSDSTFNAWIGCQRVSPACESCYAEAFAKRIGHGKRLPQVWGPDAERRPMSEAYWRAPLKWSRDAVKAGVRLRVFCSSLADVFEIPPERNEQAREVTTRGRHRLWDLINETRHGLDWLLLTKRPENVAVLAPWGKHWPPNVWLGTTCEDQKRANERLPWLLRLRTRGVDGTILGPRILFVSYEPALEPVDFTRIVEWEKPGPPFPVHTEFDALGGIAGSDLTASHPGLDWIICGGESGPHARPFRVEWARDTVRACREHGVAPFVKQLGAHVRWNGMSGPGEDYPATSEHWPTGTRSEDDGRGGFRVFLKDRAGADVAEWPPDLRVQDFPTPRSTA